MINNNKLRIFNFKANNKIYKYKVYKKSYQAQTINTNNFVMNINNKRKNKKLKLMNKSKHKKKN